MCQSQIRPRPFMIRATILGLIFLAACTQPLVRQLDIFTFGDPLTGVELSTVFTSPEATLAGFDGQLTATITAPGTLILNGTPVAGTTTDVEAGDKIAVRLTSSDSFDTEVSATVTVDGKTAEFSVTTRARPAAPTITTFTADTDSPNPGASVTLSWTVTGDVESIRLTSNLGDDVSIPVGTNTSVVTAPEHAPSVTYTLTVKNDETNDEDSGSLAVQVPLWVCVDETYPLTFPDSEFEAALRSSVLIPDTGPISCAQMQALVELSTPTGDGSGLIQELIGLQHAINLEDLTYNGHEIVSLAPVAGLTKLRVLSVDRNRHFLDLSPLQNLQALEVLGLWDVGPVLSSGTTGEEAALDGLDNNELDKVAGLTNIEVLYISSNNVNDLGFVAGMSKLRVIYAMNNDIIDFGPLAGKPDLRTALLGYQRTPVTQNVSAFNTSPLLALLGLEYGRVGNTDFLATKTALWEVRLQGNRLHDTGIAGLRGNAAFPVASRPDESVAGPAIAVAPTLRLENNCLDTTAGSATQTWITGLQGGTPAVDVTGYPTDQTLCSASLDPTIRQAKMLRDLEAMRIAGELR